MFDRQLIFLGTMCPGSSDPFYIVTYYIKCATTFWTYSICVRLVSVGGFFSHCIICSKIILAITRSA